MPVAVRLLATMTWVLVLEDAGARAGASGADAVVRVEAPREAPASFRGSLPTLLGFGTVGPSEGHGDSGTPADEASPGPGDRVIERER